MPVYLTISNSNQIDQNIKKNPIRSARMEHQNFNKNLSIPTYANINYQENSTIHQSIPHLVLKSFIVVDS
jgi:late competence protein required for DNA uptake (superfamily II DNA/RNA helicase)